MYFLKLLSSVSDYKDIDSSIVEGLYTLSKRSYTLNILLSTLVTVALYPVLENIILMWYGIVLSFVLYRLYTTYVYNHSQNRNDYKLWIQKFRVQALITAVLYSSLGFLLIYQVGYYYQLFIFSILLGLSASSSFALSLDLRLSIAYMMTLLVPLIVTLLFLDMPLHIILALMLFMYLFAQVTTIYKIYMQKKQIDSLETEQTVLHQLFENAPLGVFTYNENLEILDCNKALANLFHRELENIIGMDLNSLQDKRILNAFNISLTKPANMYRGPYISIKGEEFWIEAKAFSFSEKEHKSTMGIGIIEDKTKEHKILQELEFLVEHDVLTGLLNRRGLRNKMKNIMEDEKHKTYYSLLVYLDLNQFKGINDSLGHTVGDAVLLNVSNRLKSSLNVACTISRLGGDEFIVIVPFLSENEKMMKSEVNKYVKYLENNFHDSFIIGDLHLHIKVSMGIIIMEPNYTNIEEIIRHADITMYHAKNSNTHISYYNEVLDKKQKELFVLQHDLAHAVEKNQFHMFYQPIVTITDEKVYAAEALIRWNHPTQGVLSPDAFIPLAIKAGLLSKITWWVLDEVCKHISRWKKDDVWHLNNISINVNAQQLIENNFADKFLKYLEKYGLNTADIIIEITERSLIDNFESTQDVINRLREVGIRCAIDDFGVGYSSLSYLKKLSFYTLKIDKEFVKDIESNPNELLLVSTILDIGRQFHYNIVIEGIEDKKQKDLLLGLDERLSYQGYYFSKPLDAAVFRKKFLFSKD